MPLSRMLLWILQVALLTQKNWMQSPQYSHRLVSSSFKVTRYFSYSIRTKVPVQHGFSGICEL